MLVTYFILRKCNKNVLTDMKIYHGKMEEMELEMVSLFVFYLCLVWGREGGRCFVFVFFLNHF